MSTLRSKQAVVLLAFVGVICLFCAAFSLQAQTTTASVSGLVIDPKGLAVPNAEISVRNVATSVETTTATDSLGQYLFRALPPGTYDMKVTVSGFKTGVRTAVTLQVNQATTIDFSLQIGEVTETVTVTADTALLNTATSEVGTVVEQRKILDLPLNGRQFTQLITLAPGVSPVNVSQNRGTSPQLGAGAVIPAIAGQNNRSNLFLLDGVYNSEPFFSGFTISPSADAIQEFKVQTHNDMAEFGQALGGTVNLVTKSGTNELHGSIYEFLRNDVLDARNFFAPKVPPFRQNQFGFTGGGPVVLPGYNGRNKTFFFGGYEGFRFTKGSQILTRVPTAAERAGDFSGQAPIFNPFTTPRTPFPNNRIPPNLFNPAIAEYLKIIPLPNLPSGPRGSNLINTGPETTTQNMFTARIDHNWGTHDTFFGRFSYSQTARITQSAIAGNQNANDFPGRNVGVSWNHIFSPTLMTNFLGGFSRYGFLSDIRIPNAEGLLTAGFSKGFPLGAGGVPFPQPPGLGVSGYFSTATSISGEWPMNVYQVQGNVTKTRGRHTFKGGFSLHDYGVRIYGNFPSETYDSLPTADLANPGTTGHPVASLLLGLPSSAFRFLGDTSQVIETKIYGAYLQDQIRVTPKLTLNIGLRFDYLRPPTERFDRLDSFDLNTGLYLLARIPPPCPQAGFCLPGPLPAGVAETRRSFMDPDWGNFGPRFGIAYRIRPSMVVRTGFGMAYDLWSGVVQEWDNGMGNWPAGEAQTATDVNLGLGTPGGPQPAFSESPFLGLPNTIRPTPFPASGFSLNRFLKVPYVYSYNLNIEKQLTDSLAMTVAYVGSKGTKTPQGLLLNIAREPGPGPVNPRRQFPDQGSFRVTNNDNASQYNSLQVKLEKRLSHGLALLSSYTWSKSIDRGCSGWFGVEGCDSQFSFNTFGDRSVSAFDLPHIYKLSYVYELPFGKGKRFLTGGPASRVLGDWQINGITTFHSGRPFSARINFDNANVGSSRGQRPDLVGNIEGPRTVEQWFNTSAFAVAAQFKHGNAGRNILRADGVQNWDFSAFKTFPITERMRLQFRAEFFNIFNMADFGIPGQILRTPSFGVVNSATEARSIQFALKIYY